MFPIRQLVKEHSELASKLARFSFLEAAQLAGGLSLLPNFHANTLRIEILQHLVAACCRGHSMSSRDDLARWVKLLNNSPMAPFEDPVEDVFVGCVNTASGGFRVLRGLFTEGDFWLERLFRFLEEKQDFPPFQEAFECIRPILKISDAMLERASLSRYHAGGGTRLAKLSIPRWKTLEPCLKAISFSDIELETLGLDCKMLKEFVLTQEDLMAPMESTSWNSLLECRPLVTSANGVIVIAPSNVIRAATRRLLERIARSGIGGFGDMFFQSEISSTFVNKIANRLEVKSLDFKPPAWPHGVPSMMPFFGFFDYGKPAIMLTHCIPISKSAEDFDGYEDLSEEQNASLHGGGSKSYYRTGSLPHILGASSK